MWQFQCFRVRQKQLFPWFHQFSALLLFRSTFALLALSIAQKFSYQPIKAEVSEHISFKRFSSGLKGVSADIS